LAALLAAFAADLRRPRITIARRTVSSSLLSFIVFSLRPILPYPFAYRHKEVFTMPGFQFGTRWLRAIEALRRGNFDVFFEALPPNLQNDLVNWVRRRVSVSKPGGITL